MDTFHLSLFGQPRLTRDGEPASLLPAGKTLALLGYLAATARPLHRDELAQLFWPDLPHQDGRANLRHKLYHLRKLFGDERRATPLFRLERDTLSLAAQPALRVDLAEFLNAPPPCTEPRQDAYCRACVEGMRAALAVYAGEFMENLHLAGHHEFAEWQEEQREACRRHALALCERLYRCLEQAGDPVGALDYVRRFIAIEPWQETARRDLMRLLAATGNSGEALRHYEAFCRDLQRELGVMPEAATQTLAESLRAGATPPDLPVPPANQVRFALPERRQVTVLYCELAPLAALDDPEEWSGLLAAPQAICQALLEKSGAFVVQFHGGGLLAYFGYPDAREDAARTAVTSALACVGQSGSVLAVRVGVHSGTMLLTPGGPPDASGLASAIAIALRERATPGQVWVSAATRELVNGYFHLPYQGDFRLGASRQDIPCFQVTGPSGARSRLEAAQRLTPLVGRTAEIAGLLKLWEETRHGVRRVVLLRGEAGIGKSRLAHALHRHISEKRHAVRELACFPEFSATPFYPLIALYEAVLGFAADDSAEAKFAKLAQYVEKHYPETARDAVPLLAHMLTLPLAEPYREPSYSPQMQRERTLAIVLDRLQSLAAQQPVLLIVEDLHWVDPSTLELLTRFVNDKKMSPVLALFTARPEFQAPWNEGAVTTLNLGPLADSAVAEMLAALGADFTQETLQNIVARADGVPLFVEEMARMAPEGGQAEIPATLQDLLAARLDRLGEAKRIAQRAATIGREFDVALLAEVVTPGHAALTSSLAALQKAGLIWGETGKHFRFKHALLQEAAYRSQAKSERQAAHRDIAAALQNHGADIVASPPEIVAQHFAAGGEIRQAIAYWIQAGQQAAQRSANLEAIAHFRNGLQHLIELPPGTDTDSLELTLQTHLGATLHACKGYGSAEAEAAFTRALALCDRADGSPALFRAMWGLWVSTMGGTGHRAASGLARQLLSLARQSNDPVLDVQAHYIMGNKTFFLGEFDTARRHLEQAIAAYRPEFHPALIGSFNENSQVTSGAFLSWVLWFLGYPEQALAASEQALAWARQAAHQHSLGYALAFATLLHRWMKLHQRAVAYAEELVALAKEHGFPLWLAVGMAVQGCARAGLGQEKSVAQIDQSLAIAREAMRGAEATFLVPLAEAHIYIGDFAAAEKVVAQALESLPHTGEFYLEAELHRLKGECLLGGTHPDPQRAAECFDTALSISRRQGAKSLELRAAMALTKLQRQPGKTASGAPLLEKIYGWFTEGFDTPDLQEAQALLLAD